MMSAPSQPQIANNVKTEPCLKQQQPVVVVSILERYLTSTELPSSSKPVSSLNGMQLLPPNSVRSCGFEEKITPILKTRSFLSVTRLGDLLDYLMLCLLGARVHEMRPQMEKSMITVLAQIADGTIVIEPEEEEEESVGVDESDLNDISDELVNWCKMILDQAKSPSHTKLKCIICSEEILARYVETHMKIHSNAPNIDKPYACPICNKHFGTLQVLNRHVRIHDAERTRDFKCEQCDYAAFTKTRLRLHMATHKKDHKPYSCPICKKRVGCLQTLNQHVSTHNAERTRDYKCECCDYAAFTKNNLRLHMATHEKDQNLLCTVCGKQFRNKLTLRVHERRRHAKDDRSSMCDVCGKTYSDVACLNLHRKRIHEGLKKKYTCDVCGEVFSHSHTFKSHKWRHEDYRPYKCDLCDKAFSHGKVLKSHRLIHTGEKPFMCEVCGRAFRQKSALTTHSYIHGASRPHQCKKCSRQFIHRVDLTRHVCPFADEPNEDDKFVDDEPNEDDESVDDDKFVNDERNEEDESVDLDLNETEKFS